MKRPSLFPEIDQVYSVPPRRLAESPLRGALWMTGAQVLFAVMALAARLGGTAKIPWQEVAASRFLIGALTAFVVARIRGSKLTVRNQHAQWVRSAFGTATAAGTFYLLASPLMSLGDAVTLFAIAPIFVALLSWPLLGERVSPSVAVAIVVSLAGVLTVAHPTLNSAPRLVALGVLTAFLSANAMIWLRKMGPDESSTAVVFQFSVLGALVMVLLSIPVWTTPDLKSGIALVVTGVAGGSAQILMTRAYGFDRAARVSAMGYSGIVLTRIFALPVLGEFPTWAQAGGSLLVMASGVILALRGRGRQLAEPPRKA
ncbi:MAG: DMT family transporter [Myxococcales bacterium]